MKKILAIISILALLGAGCGVQKQEDQQLGLSDSGAAWTVYSKFDGYQTLYDPEKISDGANPMGQNTTSNHGDRISIREQGFALFPSNAFFSATSTGVVTMHTFRLRDGTSIMMRSTSATLEWYDAHGSYWELLGQGYQNGDFGYADNNVNTDQSSYVYFGNSRDAFSRWNGAHSFFTIAPTSTAGTLFVSDTSNFTATGTVAYCGATVTYTGKTATTFTVASAAECGAGRGIAQGVQTFDNQALYPRGNIYLFADNRLFISGTTNTQNIVYFSSYGSSTSFDIDSLVTSSTLADPGLFNLPEGGGPVKAMVMDEGSIYIFKPAIIYKATLTDTTYSIAPLKAFDGRSQTTGAIGKRNVFVTSNGSFFVTPDNQILLLSRIDDINYPQTSAISDIIRPTVQGLYFASSTGVVFQDKAYFATKSEQDAPVNDVVLVYNLDTQAWDSPIVGWSVADWAIYPDPVTGLDALFFSDGATNNTYQVINQPQDYQYSTVANWRSKRFTFGAPQALKYIENVYFAGYIAPNTTISISLLLDEDGYTRRYTTTLSGTDSAYIFNSQIFNSFGLRPFGTTRFGAQEDLTGLKRFRVYLGKDFQQIPFYNAQIEVASDGENQNWEIDDFGFAVRMAPVVERANLYKAFK